MPVTIKKYAVIFTDREVEIVRMISRGYSRISIAECFGITIKTLHGIFVDIQRRVQANNTAHLVGIMFRDNLID